MSFKVNHATAWVGWNQIGFGVGQYSFFDTAYPCPLGVFWGLAVSGDGLVRFEIYDTWVIEQARRQGIARAILNEIKKNNDVITTVGVKSPEGLAFVNATGFHYDKKLAGWYLWKARGRNLMDNFGLPITVQAQAPKPESAKKKAGKVRS